MKSCERGLLLCLNKATGALAQVVVDLDYEYAEELLQRAERINRHVNNDTLPERMAFDETVCPRCPYYGVCLPDHVGREPIAFLADETVETLLEDRAVHERDARAFRKADERLKAWAKARPEDRLTVGRWLLVKRPFARGVRVEVKAVGEARREAS